MAHEFKYVKLPDDHGFDDEHLKFLETLDKALIDSKEGISKKDDLEKVQKEMQEKLEAMKSEFNYDKIQEQLNHIFANMNKGKDYSKEDKSARERELNQKWVKALLKRDNATLKEVSMQLKTDPSNALHTGSRSGLDSSSDNYGGHLVPDLFLAEVNRFIEQYGVARREMRYLPFGGEGNERTIPTLTTGITTYWVDEGASKTVSRPQFGTVTQKLKTVAALSIMTEEIIEDSAIDIVSFVTQLMGEAIAEAEDKQFLAGDTDGTDTWDGVIHADNVETVAMTTTDKAEDITPDHLLELIDKLKTSERIGAKFFMHPTVWSKIRAYRATTHDETANTGAYLVQSPTDGGPGSFWGYPVVLSDALPSVSDADTKDDPFMFFTNLKRTAVYGDKQGLRVKVLTEATIGDGDNDIKLAQHDMVGLRVHKRVGYVPVLPGAIAVLQNGPTT